MLFNSLPFLVFLPVVVFLYYLLPHKWRWLLLLPASYFFYGSWKVEYLALIAISTAIDFFAARYIAASTDKAKRQAALAISIFTNLGILFFFKYTGWLLQDVVLPAIDKDTPGALEWFRLNWFILPVGISFYTFQSMAYTIDVYYGRIKPEANFGKFALFISYFPQLVAGPIERYSRLHPQLFASHGLRYQNIRKGLQLMLYGFFVKMCVADNISPYVDKVFADPNAFASLDLVLGALLFGLQIYSDFHGYSLIAIGVAATMGVDLMDNFNAPYTSTSIREFWSRWHISLSTWFRDYVFIPLGGSRVGEIRLAFNIMAVFVLSGIWHGANWTFLAWGGMHGAFYLIEKYTWQKLPPTRMFNGMKWMLTMIIVFGAWVFFRAGSVADAVSFLRGAACVSTVSASDLDLDLLTGGFLAIFLLTDLLFRNERFDTWINRQALWARWALYLALLYAILGFAGTVNHPFIYFQF